MRLPRLIFPVLILVSLFAPAPLFAGGIGISRPGHLEPQLPPPGLRFNPYKVPSSTYPRANRDLEFLWSNNYRTLFNRPLDSLYLGQTQNDLDRLGYILCEQRGENPFAFDETDIPTRLRLP